MRIIEQQPVFGDRIEAGYEVGSLLQDKYRDKNALVVGIPLGGVVVAYSIAQVLNAELSAIITKKLLHPLYPELSIGTMAEDGSVYLNTEAHDIDKAVIKRMMNNQSTELENRIMKFRDGRMLPEMDSRIVIIVDDGITTGSTIIPAIKLCKRRNAAKVIVASPVSSERYLLDINDFADEIVIADEPDMFYTVGQAYHDYHSLTDEEVIRLLDKFELQFKGTTKTPIHSMRDAQSKARIKAREIE